MYFKIYNCNKLSGNFKCVVFFKQKKFLIPSVFNRKLDHNKIKNVSKGWTYGLTSLRELYLAMNKINSIDKDTWEACKNIETM